MDTLPGFGKGRSAGKDAQRGGLCGGLCLSEAVTKKFELIERETKGPSRVNILPIFCGGEWHQHSWAFGAPVIKTEMKFWQNLFIS